MFRKRILWISLILLILFIIIVSLKRSVNKRWHRSTKTALSVSDQKVAKVNSSKGDTHILQDSSNREYRTRRRKTAPGRNDDEYQEVFGAWENARGKFRQREVPFENGMITEYYFASGKLEKRVGIWRHVLGYCRVKIDFAPDWSVISHDADCKRTF